MYHNIDFASETIDYFLKLYTKYNYENEFSQTLCLSHGKIIEGGELCVGGNCGVKKPAMICEVGVPIGDLHSHTEPYYQRAPFDKGQSDIDIFGIIKDGLNKKMVFPHVGCVLAPVADEKTHRLAGYDITCEQFDEFMEEDIKGIPTGIVKNDTKEYFNDENIEYIKKGSPPSESEGGWGGTFRRMGFTIGMAHIKMSLAEKGLMKQDGFFIKLKQDTETEKYYIEWDEKKAVLFKKE